MAASPSSSSKRKSQKLKSAPMYRARLAVMIQHASKIVALRAEILVRSNEVSQLKEKARAIMKEREERLPFRGPLLLETFVEKQELLLKEQKKVIEKRRQTLLTASMTIQKGMAYNSKFDAMFIEAYESYNADRQTLQMLERKLKLRQHKMCRQLLHIFPFRRVRDFVENTDNNNNNLNGNNNSGSSISSKLSSATLYTQNFEIRNMALPSRVSKLMAIANQSGPAEEQMSIGLGYIAHLCTLLSRYLKTPLRHPIVCRGSRSMIVDAFLEAESFASLREGNRRRGWNPQYPLYSKGVDRGRFKHGIDLLREDICQLCTQCKIPDYEPELFIQNIRVVLYSMALARF